MHKMAGGVEGALLLSAGYSYLQRLRRGWQSGAAATQIQRRARALSARVRFSRRMRALASARAARPCVRLRRARPGGWPWLAGWGLTNWA